MRARCQGLAIEAFMIALAADAAQAIVNAASTSRASILSSPPRPDAENFDLEVSF
jgi:hypothetical protein